MMKELSIKTRSKLEWLGQIVYFTSLTIIFSRPLLSRIGTHVANRLGDNLYFIWQIGWFKQALFDLGQLPHHSHLLNFPDGYSLAISEIAPLQLGFALPFALFGELVLGYNVAMLLTFVLAGLTMSAWVQHLSGSKMAGVLAGSAYAFLPYHIAHFLIGHLNIAAIQWFPLYFWGFFEILHGKEPRKRNIFLLAAGLSGIALSSQYYLYATLLVSMVLLVFYLTFMQRDRWLNVEMWKRFLFAGLLAAPALLVGILPYMMVHRSATSARTLGDVMTFSASITDFLLPATRHFVLGKWVGGTFPRDLWNEATLYLGLPVSVLGLLALKKRKQTSQSELLPLLLVGFILSVVLAMGTNLTWMEEPVRLQPDSWLVRLLPSVDGLLLLPGYYLFKHLPFYDLMRAWMRIGIFAMLFNCAAAGLGLQWLLGRVKERMRIPVGLLALGLIMLDFYVSPISLSEVRPRQVDLWLAEKPYGGQVQLPFRQSFEEFSLYATLYNQKPLMGTIRTFPSNRFFQMVPLLENFPDEASVAALQEVGVRYIVLDESYYPLNDTFLQLCADLGLRWQVSLDGQSVFLLP